MENHPPHASEHGDRSTRATLTERRERVAEASAETVLAELNDRLKSTLRGIAFDLGTIRGATQSDDHALRQVIRNARAAG